MTIDKRTMRQHNLDQVLDLLMAPKLLRVVTVEVTKELAEIMATSKGREWVGVWDSVRRVLEKVLRGLAMRAEMRGAS